ncbi:uncharacterized protein PHALS_12547 [Plasmopara halstedii]|uniref:Uncharacterized protein n=1 Tax=Plasmopara halstedii TaxID=4781 RepID=A0A0P1ANA7_PLAHL|nr:uncharacterized protein PHALS_12547 [Plasmopara halstedii]CEG42257.1 hypothetical protein PHALS_12547 [Plasmopara halstedii]|eukprot:XP_024578626.1 hypothetical protein PHALS_12547 [Plasmopara halstedii]
MLSCRPQAQEAIFFLETVLTEAEYVDIKLRFIERPIQVSVPEYVASADVESIGSSGRRDIRSTINIW